MCLLRSVPRGTAALRLLTLGQSELDLGMLQNAQTSAKVARGLWVGSTGQAPRSEPTPAELY